MSICEKDQVEQFLNNNTFFCKLQRARLSHLACRIQSARAYKIKKESEEILERAKHWNQDGEATYKLKGLLHALMATCLRCPKYEKPTKAFLRKHPTRKPFSFGRFSNDKDGLPGTSPISEVIS